MYIETKYNIGDKVITVTNYGIEAVTVDAIKISVKGDSASVKYYVIDSDDMGEEKDESLLFSSIGELVDFANKELNKPVDTMKESDQ